MTETQIKKENKDSEIDLVDIAKKIWSGRKIIIKTMIVFFVLGIFIVIFSPKEYKSEITLVVETSASGSGMSGLLQQFGGLAGININKSEKEALIPELYPEIIKSTPFLLEIVKHKITESKNDSTMSIEKYLDNNIRSSFTENVKKYTIGFPNIIVQWFRDNKNSSLSNTIAQNPGDSTLSFNPLKITNKQAEIIEKLAGRISTEQDFKKSNKFKIIVEMQDPYVVAQITSIVVKELTKYLIQYRTKKAKTDLEFISDRTIEAETRYLEKQKALALYKDRNKNVILSSVLSEEEQLQSEYDLAYDVYSTLAKQLEQSKIKVQEATPVFNVINPAQVPLQKSKPKSFLIICIISLLGIVAGIGIVLVKTCFLIRK